MVSGAHFRLLNGTTKYSAVAELVCPSQEIVRSNRTKSSLSLLFRCREDGIWTEVISGSNTGTDSGNETAVGKSQNCIKQRHNGFLYFYGSGHKVSKLRKSFYLRENSVSMLHFLAAIVVIAFISILFIVVLLFKRYVA